MKKSLFILAAIMLLLGACNPTDDPSLSTSTSPTDITSDPSDSSEPTSSEPNDGDGEENPGYYEGTYGHAFKQTDFSSNGGVTEVINGLAWQYSPFSFLGGSGNGVQIGSSNNPQTSPWTLSASFPSEVTVVNVQFEIANASGGSGTYEVSFGSTTWSGDYQTETQTLTKFDYEGDETLAEGISFTFQANAKALYLYQLNFSLHIPSDVNFPITVDIEAERDPVVPGQNGIPSTRYEPSTKESYFASVDLSTTGETLKSTLTARLENDSYRSRYGDAKSVLLYADEDPNNPGYVLGMWDGDKIPAIWDQGASWNREHVWAYSHLQLPGTQKRGDDANDHTADLFNLRVACQFSNGFHGNKFFDEANTDDTMFPNITSGLNGYHAYTGDWRGDVARICFYMFVRYPGLKLVSATTGDDVSMGNLTALLAWNELDPVDAFEIQRNNRIYEYQGNRNPFVDYPELAGQLFQ